MDAIIEKEVFDRFDHKHLNVDCPEFEDLIPTSENLAKVIFEKLQPALKTDARRLSKIGLNETQKGGRMNFPVDLVRRQVGRRQRSTHCPL